VEKISIELENENIFKTTLKEGENLGDWFSRIMAILFENYGLIIVDSMDENIRQLETGFFKSALKRTKETYEKLHFNTKKVIELGEKPLIDVKEENTNLFIQHNEERLPLKVIGSGFYCDGYFGRTEFSYEDLEEIITKTPELLSTNVVYRPLVQDVLFPTVAYIAGPGETAYYAQISGVYKNFDMEMPVIFPRENYTLIPKNIQKIMKELNLVADDVLNHKSNGIERAIVLKDLEVDIPTEFHFFEDKFNNMYDELIRTIEIEVPEILNIKEQNKELILSQIEYLKEKAYRFSRKERKDIIEDFKKVKAWIYNKNIQERELGFINQKELMIPELIEFLIHETDIDYNHKVVIL
jgi:bacillithiol biosynthesis cysteine-adding enzyme BshC